MYFTRIPIWWVIWKSYGVGWMFLEGFFKVRECFDDVSLLLIYAWDRMCWRWIKMGTKKTNPLDATMVSDNWDQSGPKEIAVRKMEGTSNWQVWNLQTVSAVRDALVEIALCVSVRRAQFEIAEQRITLDWKQAARLLKNVARQGSWCGAVSKASEYWAMASSKSWRLNSELPLSLCEFAQSRIDCESKDC